MKTFFFSSFSSLISSKADAVNSTADSAAFPWMAPHYGDKHAFWDENSENFYKKRKYVANSPMVAARMGRFGLGFSHRLLKGLKGSANTHSTASNLKDGGKTEHASGELSSHFMKVYCDTFQVLAFGYGVIRYDNSRCEDTETAVRIQVLLQDGNKKLQEIYDCCKEFKITKDDKTSSTLKKG